MGGCTLLKVCRKSMLLHCILRKMNLFSCRAVDSTNMLALYVNLWYSKLDLMVGYQEDYRRDATKCDSIIMSQVLADWMEQLLELTFRKTPKIYTAQKLYKAKYPLPDKLSFIHCQKQACVLGKSTHTIYKEPPKGALRRPKA